MRRETKSSDPARSARGAGVLVGFDNDARGVADQAPVEALAERGIAADQLDQLPLAELEEVVGRNAEGLGDACQQLRGHGWALAAQQPRDMGGIDVRRLRQLALCQAAFEQQVADRLAEALHPDAPSPARSRSSLRRILPDGVFGSSSRMWTTRGYL